MSEPAPKRYAYGEYLQVERDSGKRHEYWNGRVVAMAGGTHDHARAIANTMLALGRQLEGRPCEVYTSELKHRHERRNTSVYPDISIYCSTPEPSATDRNAFTNPTLVVEVLSPGTELHDRHAKLELYLSTESIETVVFVNWGYQLLEVYSRDGQGGLRLHQVRAGESAVLDAIGCTLDVDTVYRKTEVPQRLDVVRERLALYGLQRGANGVWA